MAKGMEVTKEDPMHFCIYHFYPVYFNRFILCTSKVNSHVVKFQAAHRPGGGVSEFGPIEGLLTKFCPAALRSHSLNMTVSLCKNVNLIMNTLTNRCGRQHWTVSWTDVHHAFRGACLWLISQPTE